MTFDDLKFKYAGINCAFPEHFKSPNDSRIIMDLIVNHACDFPKSYIDFQLIHCHETPMGDFAQEGFRWANDKVDPSESLKDLILEFRSNDYPDYLTPFGFDDEGYWCFDKRLKSEVGECRVVIYSPEQNEITTERRWQNFIFWLDATMDENY
ncbi:MAG: SMI1/KNR4 family protein [Cyclobacteriaceae bacterium]